MKPCCYPFCSEQAVQFLAWRPLHQPDRWRSECRCEQHRADGGALEVLIAEGAQLLSLEELECWEAAQSVHES